MIDPPVKATWLVLLIRSPTLKVVDPYRIASLKVLTLLRHSGPHRSTIVGFFYDHPESPAIIFEVIEACTLGSHQGKSQRGFRDGFNVAISLLASPSPAPSASSRARESCS